MNRPDLFGPVMGHQAAPTAPPWGGGQQFPQGSVAEPITSDQFQAQVLQQQQQQQYPAAQMQQPKYRPQEPPKAYSNNYRNQEEAERQRKREAQLAYGEDLRRQMSKETPVQRRVREAREAREARAQQAAQQPPPNQPHGQHHHQAQLGGPQRPADFSTPPAMPHPQHAPFHHHPPEAFQDQRSQMQGHPQQQAAQFQAALGQEQNGQLPPPVAQQQHMPQPQIQQPPRQQEGPPPAKYGLFAAVNDPQQELAAKRARQRQALEEQKREQEEARQRKEEQKRKEKEAELLWEEREKKRAEAEKRREEQEKAQREASKLEQAEREADAKRGVEEAKERQRLEKEAKSRQTGNTGPQAPTQQAPLEPTRQQTSSEQPQPPAQPTQPTHPQHSLPPPDQPHPAPPQGMVAARNDLFGPPSAGAPQDLFGNLPKGGAANGQGESYKSPMNGFIDDYTKRNGPLENLPRAQSGAEFAPSTQLQTGHQPPNPPSAMDFFNAPPANHQTQPQPQPLQQPQLPLQQPQFQTQPQQHQQPPMQQPQPQPQMRPEPEPMQQPQQLPPSPHGHHQPPESKFDQRKREEERKKQERSRPEMELTCTSVHLEPTDEQDADGYFESWKQIVCAIDPQGEKGGERRIFTPGIGQGRGVDDLMKSIPHGFLSPDAFINRDPMELPCLTEQIPLEEQETPDTGRRADPSPRDPPEPLPDTDPDHKQEATPSRSERAALNALQAATSVLEAKFTNGPSFEEAQNQAKNQPDEIGAEEEVDPEDPQQGHIEPSPKKTVVEEAPIYTSSAPASAAQPPPSAVHRIETKLPKEQPPHSSPRPDPPPLPNFESLTYSDPGSPGPSGIPDQAQRQADSRKSGSDGAEVEPHSPPPHPPTEPPSDRFTRHGDVEAAETLTILREQHPVAMRVLCGSQDSLRTTKGPGAKANPAGETPIKLPDLMDGTHLSSPVPHAAPKNFRYSQEDMGDEESNTGEYSETGSTRFSNGEGEDDGEWGESTGLELKEHLEIDTANPGKSKADDPVSPYRRSSYDVANRQKAQGLMSMSLPATSLALGSTFHKGLGNSSKMQGSVVLGASQSARRPVLESLPQEVMAHAMTPIQLSPPSKAQRGVPHPSNPHGHLRPISAPLNQTPPHTMGAPQVLPSLPLTGSGSTFNPTSSLGGKNVWGAPLRS